MRPALPAGAHGSMSLKEMSAGGWRATTRYRDWSGDLHQANRFAPTRQAARLNLEAALKNILAASAGGAAVTSETTLCELADLWIEELPYLPLADATKRVYRSMLNHHIQPKGSPLRAAPIRTLTGAKLSAALRQVATSSGPGAAKTLASVYRNLFGFAMQHEALENNPTRNMMYAPSQFRDNPHPKAKSKGGQDRTRDHDRAFTDDERAGILNEVRTNPYYELYQLRILVEVLAGTGVRIGEACRLRWAHIDFESGLIRVPGTKSASARRVVEAPDWLLATLREKYEEWHPGPFDPVCPSPMLKWRDSSNSIRSLGRALESMGYPWATSHTFRRTVASKLDRAGVSVQEVANQLGHAQVSTTMNEYLDRRAIPRLGKHL